MTSPHARRAVAVAAALALAAALGILGCSSGSATGTGGGALIEPGNPLVPAQTASATIGGANQKTNDTQQQLDDLTGGDE